MKESSRYLQEDATKLSTYSLGSFPLVIDGGCMHGFSDPDRDVCLRRSKTAAASPGYQPTGSGTALWAEKLGTGLDQH